MTEPEVGRPTISERERDTIAAWTADVARERQEAADAKAATTGARRRLMILLALGFAAVLVLGGVWYGVSQASSDSDPTPRTSAAPTAPPSAAPSPEPSEAPVALTPVQQAEAEAEAAYREFLRVDNAIAQSGYQDTAPYDAVVVTPERSYIEEQAALSREAGERRIGDITPTSVSVVRSELEPGPGNYPFVVLQVCEDVSAVNVVDRTGKSTVAADRGDTVLSRFTMNYYEPGTAGVESGGWRVYAIDTPGGETC